MSEETPTPEETPAAPTPGTPEYNAQMAAEGQAATGNVPDKFKNDDGSINIDGMAKAYMELEKQFHQPKDETPAEPVQEAPADKVEPEAVVDELRVPDQPEPEQVSPEELSKDIVTAEEFEGMTAQIMKSGDISPEQRAVLNERGLPNSVIDNMVAGHRATMREQFTKASQVVGGDERLSKIFGWAANNLDPAQRAAVNAGLASTASEATLLGLAAMYDKASALPTNEEPKEANRYVSNPSSNSVKGFATKTEYYAASNDPRMLSDPSYRQQVEQRMIMTNWSSIA